VSCKSKKNFQKVLLLQLDEACGTLSRKLQISIIGTKLSKKKKRKNKNDAKYIIYIFVLPKINWR